MTGRDFHLNPQVGTTKQVIIRIWLLIRNHKHVYIITVEGFIIST